MSESAPEDQSPPTSEPHTEWVKQRISDEEITKMQEEVRNLNIRLENSVKMLHQRDVIIRKQAELLEAYGISMVVLARNSASILDQSTEGMI